MQLFHTVPGSAVVHTYDFPAITHCSGVIQQGKQTCRFKDLTMLVCYLAMENISCWCVKIRFTDACYLQLREEWTVASFWLQVVNYSLLVLFVFRVKCYFPLNFVLNPARVDISTVHSKHFCWPSCMELKLHEIFAYHFCSNVRLDVSVGLSVLVDIPQFTNHIFKCTKCSLSRFWIRNLPTTCNLCYENLTSVSKHFLFRLEGQHTPVRCANVLL